MGHEVYSLPGFYEPFCAFSHLSGALVFALLAYFLVRRGRGDGRRVTLLGLYAFSCIALLALSGVYHMLPEGATSRNVLGRLDMAAIFVLIAGTHTPVQGFFFRGFARWGVLTLMWALAVTGVTLFSVFYSSLPDGLVTGVYLLLGWIAGIAGLIAWRRHGAVGMGALILGGVVYTVGAILLGLQWPTLIPGVIGHHEIWHVAVLVAMGLHWSFMYRIADRPLDGPIAC